MPIQEEMKLVGYVIMGDVDPNIPEGVARLLYDGFQTTQNWFPIGQCLEYCIDHGVTDPKVYTLDEFLKVVPRIHIA
jgi:hypothetical protein